MAPLELSVCFWNYDRTMPLYDRRVQIAGCAPRFAILTPEQAFDRTFVTDEFDAGELSLSYHLSALARGDARYIAIPVFPSRSFRHSTIYIRSDRGINSPADLAGKRLGVQDYDMTAAVVVRGFLRDDYGVSAEQIAWTIGDVESLWRSEISVRRVARVEISTVVGRTLDSMLVDGELDGVIALRPLASFRNGTAGVVRLFKDWRRAEQEFFQRTGFFPIMHIVGIRSTLVDRCPWLPQSLYTAFAEAKRLAIDELEQPQVPKVTLPWVNAEVQSTREVMGKDFWPYGVAANRNAIERFARYHVQEGLSDRLIQMNELFPTGAGDPL